jgi:class 3 adenylate cyclase
VSEERTKDPLSKLRHDLRTPINQIIGYSELLQEEAEGSGQPAYVSDLQKIQLAARRLLALIDENFAPGKLSLGGAPAAVPAPAAEAERPAAEHALEAAAPAALTGGAAAGPARPAPAASTGPGSVLVVDDNEMNRDMLSRRLKAKGFAVELAEDGYKALEKLDATAFDLVLLDIMMPGMSGIEVLRKVRETRTAADLPIIMATAKAQSEDVVEALKLGANDYVTKPIDFPVALARVNTQLSLKRAGDEIRRLVGDLEVRNRFIRNTFGRYLSDEIVSSILENPEGLELGGQRRIVTILMSDLRGFTSTAERLAPEQVVRMLNHYLGAMADVIMQYRGTIDEFIGDAILVIFGAPVQRQDDAQRAVACAAAMQLAMDGVNAWNREQGLPEVEMGIALHTGEVVVGNIGSEKRAKYGVVGTTVNLTSRIETYTVGGQVLLSDATYKASGAAVSVGGQMSVRAKGAKDPIVAWDLRGIAGEWNVALPTRDESHTTLKAAVPARFYAIEGKSVSDNALDASLIALSPRGALLRSQFEAPLLTNLKLHLTGDDGAEVPGDLYAKVVEKPAGSDATFAVRFTSMPPEVEIFIKKRLAAA